MPYGLISTFFPAGGRSRPTRFAAADTRKIPMFPPTERGTGAR
jgi:hypothetical protein